MDVGSVFIYLTERCNLGCRYCYFRCKRDRQADFFVLKKFLRQLSVQGISPGMFEITGGEPLLCRGLLVKVVALLRREFPRARIGVQTNGLLLTPALSRHLSRENVGLEVGIDGVQAVTTRWRRGMGAEGFKRLVRNILFCRSMGMYVAATMTVHPQEVRGMTENFMFLCSLGIKDIDVTPAAFMPWDAHAMRLFRQQYVRIMRQAKDRDCYAGEDAVRVFNGKLDLSFHPPGHVLCGDAYLCLPQGVKERFSVWDKATGHFAEKNVEFFLGQYHALLCKRDGSHREYVCAGFKIVNKMMGRAFVNVRTMVPLMRFLSRMHGARASRNLAG